MQEHSRLATKEVDVSSEPIELWLGFAVDFKFNLTYISEEYHGWVCISFWFGGSEES